jgi:hypothetical protein
MILIFVIGIPAGLLIQWHKKHTYIAALPTVRMSISVGGEDVDEGGAVRYARGRPQTLRISINWDKQELYWSERPIRVALSRNGKVQYDHLWRHDEIIQFDALAFDITDKFPVGHYLIGVTVEGAPPAQHEFVVEPRPPGIIFVSDIPPQWPRQEVKTLQHRPGETKKIYVYVQVKGTLPAEGRNISISLSHEGTMLLNYSNHVTEQNRDFYIPYEADFSEGLYTARLSANDEPPAQFEFRVQYPIAETQEQKDQRIKNLLDAVLPGSGSQGSADCYAGTWRENASNEFTWLFERQENSLRISRNDGFASGVFQKSPDGWTGVLNWGDGTRWDGVVLHDANASCTEITTNQRWWYRR